EVACVVVHLDRRVTRRAGGLLVGSEERILERGDERALLDSLVALDLADRLDDLLAHVTLPRRSDSPARSRRTGSRSRRRRTRPPSPSLRPRNEPLRAAFAAPQFGAGQDAPAPPRNVPAAAAAGPARVRRLRRCTRADSRAGRR